MPNEKLRRQITCEAARLMYSRNETEYSRAKLRAARRLHRGRVKPADLPSDAEIRDEINRAAWIYEGDARFDNLREMRLFARQMLLRLEDFHPRLTGSTLREDVRWGSGIDIHLTCDNIDALTSRLDADRLHYTLITATADTGPDHRTITLIHVQDQFDVELTCFPSAAVDSGSAHTPNTDQADLQQLEELIAARYPDVDLHTPVDSDQPLDRFRVYRMLMLPLEQVEQHRSQHPEGDALYHSLQVFELARTADPWDEEFLLAALLHDVGMAIDPLDHVAAGLEALGETITDRTHWLIGHQVECQMLYEGTLGARTRKRLQEHEDYETLLLLGQCDRDGRVPGASVPDLDEALDAIREVARLCG